MRSIVTKTGQVVPAALRQQHQIRKGDSLVWIEEGPTLRVVLIAADPIRALRGPGRGEALNERLLEQRSSDRP